MSVNSRALPVPADTVFKVFRAPLDGVLDEIQNGEPPLIGNVQIVFERDDRDQRPLFVVVAMLGAELLQLWIAVALYTTDGIGTEVQIANHKGLGVVLAESFENGHQVRHFGHVRA